MATTSVDQLLEPFLTDSETSPIGAEYVVAPPTLEDAATVLRIASEHGLRTLLAGSGTHQGFGHRLAPDLVLSTKLLNRVVTYEPEDLTVVVESGMTLAELDALLAERRQTAALPEQSGSATVGGVVAAGVSGWQRLGYGPIRDRMLEAKLVTGDGRIVTGGGRVVKNVSGYDIPRLVTGSLGSLGLVGAVCLKLWPQPAYAGSIAVADAGEARQRAYRPRAIIETNRGTTVYVTGTAAYVEGQVRDLHGTVTPGLQWPDPLGATYEFSLRVPAALTPHAVDKVRDLGRGVQFQAAHGVGEVRLAANDLDLRGLVGLRSWAESVSGAVVTVRAPDAAYDVFDPWGTAPPTLELQRRVKRAFDPAGVVNPGRLPGGL